METKNIELIENEIIDEFQIFDDWLDKYNHLIELSKSLTPFEAEKKTDQFVIQGCQSRVWIDAKLEDGNVRFFGDSDAIITKGMVALLVRVLDNQPPQVILDANLDFISKIGLSENLSPTRANGLLAMIKQLKLYALIFSQQQNK